MKLFTLLCCINPTVPSDCIDEYMLYHIINPIAAVINIKVFDKSSQIKIFVQVLNKAMADIVIKELHCKCFKFGKLKIFVSHKKYIAFDRTVNQILADGNKNSIENRISNVNSKIIKGIKKGNTVSNDISEDYCHYNFLNEKKISQNQQHTKLLNNSAKNNHEIEYNNAIKKISNHLLKILDNKKCIDEFAEFYLLPKKHKKEKPFSYKSDHCITISHINTDEVSVDSLFNFFGCFGNVLKLQINEQQGKAVIEYETESQVHAAVKYSDCIRFFAQILHVTPFNEKKQTNVLNNEFFEGAVLFTNNPTNFRFTAEISNETTPLSKFILISGFPIFTPVSTVKSYIRQIHKPLKITPIRPNNSSGETFMVEFEFSYQSIQLLSILHNALFQGNRLSVRFIDLGLKIVLSPQHYFNL